MTTESQNTSACGETAGVGTGDLLAELKAEVERTRKELWELPSPCDFHVLRASQENYNYARHQLAEYLSANTPVSNAHTNTEKLSDHE